MYDTLDMSESWDTGAILHPRLRDGRSSWEIITAGPPLGW